MEVFRRFAMLGLLEVGPNLAARWVFDVVIGTGRGRDWFLPTPLVRCVTGPRSNRARTGEIGANRPADNGADQSTASNRPSTTIRRLLVATPRTCYLNPFSGSHVSSNLEVFKDTPPMALCRLRIKKEL